MCHQKLRRHAQNSGPVTGSFRSSLERDAPHGVAPANVSYPRPRP